MGGVMSLHDRRTLAALDANAPPPVTYTNTTRENTMTMTTPTLPARPPRPAIPPPALLAAAVEAGFDADDVNAVRLGDDGDLIVNCGAGVEYVVVPEDRPDGAGRHGALLFARAPGYNAWPRGPRFVPRKGSGWTIADLEWSGRKLNPPMPEAVADGLGGFKHWLFDAEDAPVRAYVLIREIARRRGMDVRQVAVHDSVAGACRQLIIDSGWLADDEAGQL